MDLLKKIKLKTENNQRKTLQKLQTITISDSMLLMGHHLSVREEKNEKIKIRCGMGKNQKCCHCFLPLKIFVRPIYKQPFFTFYPQPFFSADATTFNQQTGYSSLQERNGHFIFFYCFVYFLFQFWKAVWFFPARDIFMQYNRTKSPAYSSSALYPHSLNISFNARQPAPPPLG